ncbi:MAG TPA: hypothetical protein PK987_06850 [Ferruginibacter sp.]|nr:hypothetical protein [Ferruginibacter sp.]
MRKQLLILLVLTIVIFSACKKTTEVYETNTVSEYYPLQVGKYITYNLDSTVFINFGTKDTIMNYQVKHVVDAEITDNLGRPAYRIIRYIRKTPANAWVPDNTFMAIGTEFTMEFVENNMRFIKLKGPVRDEYTWKGNSYIDLGTDYRYLEDWDYTYDSVNVSLTIGAYTLDSTLKVNQLDESDEVIGNPADPNSYSEINNSTEKYAKGIGMVYRNFLHVEYQPATPGRGAYRIGYGVRLTMIDHN